MCPECGAGLSGRTVARGAPRPAGFRPYLAGLLLALAVGVAVLNLSHVLQRINWYGHAPFEWVLADSRSTNSKVAFDAWTELDRRETAGGLSGAQRKAMIDRGLAEIATAPTGLGSSRIRQESLGSKPGWHGYYWPESYRLSRETGDAGPLSGTVVPSVRGERIEPVVVPLLSMEQSNGSMDASQESVYISHVAEVSLEVRSKVRRGSTIPYFHAASEYLPFCGMAKGSELSLDGTVVPEAPISAGQVRDLPSASLSLGRHTLTMSYFFPRVNGQPIKLTQSATFDITDQPTVDVEKDGPGLSLWAPGDPSAFLFAAPDGHLEFGCSVDLVNKSKTVFAAAEIIARTADREVVLGAIVVPRNTCTSAWAILRDAPKWHPEQVQIVVRSSPSVAERTLGVTKIPACDFVCGAVPVRKAIKIDYTKLPCPEVTFEK